MVTWERTEIEKCLSKITSFVGLDNHIIRAHPKNPRKGADEALKFKSTVLPEIIKDVEQTIHFKVMHGDEVSESVVKTEIILRINIELVKIGVAMLPLSDQ